MGQLGDRIINRKISSAASRANSVYLVQLQEKEKLITKNGLLLRDKKKRKTSFYRSKLLIIICVGFFSLDVAGYPEVMIGHIYLVI